MTFDLNLHPRPFYLIQNGVKDVEMRLNTPIRQQIKVGDIIRFTNRDSGLILTRRVKAIKTFKNFEELYNAYPKSRLGYSEKEKADYHDMNEYYSNEDINKYGVIAFEIEEVE